MDFEPGQLQGLQMCHPGLPVGKDPGLVFAKPFDEVLRQSMVAHVIERRIIDLVAGV